MSSCVKTVQLHDTQSRSARPHDSMTGAIKESGKQQLTEMIIVLRACCHGFGEICRASCTGPAFGCLFVMLNVPVSQCRVSAKISSSTLETVVMVCLWFCLDFSAWDWIIWHFLFCLDFFSFTCLAFLRWLVTLRSLNSVSWESSGLQQFQCCLSFCS